MRLPAFGRVLLGVALVATTLLFHGATPTLADTEQTVSNGGNPSTGYWQICTDFCYLESINYTFSGYWDMDTWYCSEIPPCRYHWTLDYESDPSTGNIAAYGDAINGQCCPDVQIGIMPNEFVDECYHSRPDCGGAEQAYNTYYDSKTQSAAVTCPQDDFCSGIQVFNEELQGFADPAVAAGACETSVGKATPDGGTCDNLGYIYDKGQ